MSMYLASRARCLFPSSFRRSFSTTTSKASPELRENLKSRVKAAMKNKDQVASNAIRSVLAEINTADKVANSEISTSNIISLLRKASARRRDAAAQYTEANRSDLAEKELQEASLLEEFVPPFLSPEEINRNLRQVIDDIALAPTDDPRKATGKIYKALYAKVDRSLVDPDVVKTQVDSLLKSMH